VAEGATQRVCPETIYAGVLDVRPTECLRTRRRRRRRRHARHETKRPGLSNIALRLAVIDKRAKFGRWEGERIIGRSNHSSMLWLTERATRLSIPATMPEGDAGEAMLAGIADGLDATPHHLSPRPSMVSAGPASTTNAPPPRTLLMPCSDHWNPPRQQLDCGAFMG
jgi:IS30 family transposase